MLKRSALTLAALAAVVATGATAGATTRSTPSRNLPDVSVPGKIAVVPQLHTQQVVGSTVDPVNGDQNPYGLTIAPAAGGMINQGDLVVCNFNDAANIQGLGTTIEVLHPVPGSKPLHLISDPTLTGCAALAMGGAAPWVAALDANDNPIVSPTGQIIDPINNFAWTGPWGQVFVAGPRVANPAFYESNTIDGSVVRIDLTNPFKFDKIITGLPVNHGVPGQILAPSGLTYDPKNDRLYVVDGDNNTVYYFKSPSKIPNGGITYTPSGFVGQSARSAGVLYSGAPLNAPISAALLFNGNLVVGNTGDNRLVEIAGGVAVAAKNLDRGIAGALFGIAASGTSVANTRIYFNDDNANAVEVLSH